MSADNKFVVEFLERVKKMSSVEYDEYLNSMKRCGCYSKYHAKVMNAHYTCYDSKGKNILATIIYRTEQVDIDKIISEYMKQYPDAEYIVEIFTPITRVKFTLFFINRIQQQNQIRHERRSDTKRPKCSTNDITNQSS